MITRFRVKMFLFCIFFACAISMASMLLSGVAHADVAENQYLYGTRLLMQEPVQPTDAELLQYGYSSCDTLTKYPNYGGVKGTVEGVYLFMNSGTARQQMFDAGVIVGAAAKFLCPWHDSLVQNWTKSSLQDNKAIRPRYA